ncbi:MAG: abortive infection family protein [Neisseriaceae bacterium]|nr:abortive infection family protein [Neisseriaceae bacterium]
MQQTYSYQFPENFEQKLNDILEEKCLVKKLKVNRIKNEDITIDNSHEHRVNFKILVTEPDDITQLVNFFPKLITETNNILKNTGLFVNTDSIDFRYSQVLSTKNNDLRIEGKLALNEFKKRNKSYISLPAVTNDDNLKTLHQEIQEKLYQGQPELALDRLHTFATTYLRKICTKYQIDTINKSNGDNLPLHSLIGSLVRKYEQQNCLSEFSTNALKNSISIFEKYNTIRNDQSYAHDNEEILNKNEAQFVVTVIINLLNFIDSIENNQSYTSLFYSPK